MSEQINHHATLPEGPEHGAGPATRVVVAIGGSAAHTSSLQRVLGRLSLGPELAVVLTLQHRESLDENAFRLGLGEKARLLRDIVDGATIEGGFIYLPASDQLVTVEQGRFKVRAAEQDPGSRGTLDSFLVSLAYDQNGRTIGLILEGTGGGGTLGITAIKEAGGLTMAEETGDTDPGDLVASNRPAALADLILPIDDIPGRLVQHARFLVRREETRAFNAHASAKDEILTQIATVLRNKTGHDFHDYKRNTFLRRVQRRMQVLQIEDFEAYVEALRARADEAMHLFNDLLIGVTQFFRDGREFELLQTQVVPKLFENKNRSHQLRVWVLGCSTGEEAYSIAILLREFMAGLEAPPQIQIFASDIDGRALASARVGRYTQSIANDMAPERLARWFVKEGTTYCVVKELREMCVFSQHSVIKDAPFSRLDLISCRNLLIYLNTELQNRVIPLFHFALNPGGFLFLGSSENASRHVNLFAPIDRSSRIYQKIGNRPRLLPEFPLGTVDRRTSEIQPPPRLRIGGDGILRRAERLAEQYAPAYAIVDDHFEVLHFSTKAGRFIHPSGGAASLNLPNLLHSDLRVHVRSALNRAAIENQTVRADGIEIGTEANRMPLDIVVEPVTDGTDSSRNFVVLFTDGLAVQSGHAAPGDPDEERVRRLNGELRVTRERLQATVEELESTNEELKSSNEEFQSLNEELQSANEELETSKEELQSVNEELSTVNGELAHRVQELGRVNSDLKNLLESTQIATIFLDNELRVANFTPRVADLFHLVDTDIGRPIGHIKMRIRYDELQDDVRQVMRNLGSVDREIGDPGTQARYMVRVLPYRSVDNFIAGAVVTFTDVTPVTRAEGALRESEERFRHLVERWAQAVWETDPNGVVVADSPSWRAFTGQTEREWRGQGWLDAIHPDDRAQAGRQWREAVAAGQPLDAEFRLRRAEGGWRWTNIRAVPLRAADGSIAKWVAMNIDITERKDAEAALWALNETLEARVAERTAELMAIEATLRQAQKMEAVGQLTGGIAHDFNNMLQGISGNLDLVERRVDQGRLDEVREFVSGASKTVERAAALTNRLLAFARRQTLQPCPVQPELLIESMADLIRRTVGPGITLELPAETRDSWMVLCDPNQLESVLLNLAINARDAIAGTGTLAIATGNVHLTAADVADFETAEPGEYVQISVSDTGSGMSPEVLARACEPFFTTKPIGQGTGLGLSQLYGFVQQSGGVLRIESKPGQGTSVRIFLRRHEPSQARAETLPPKPQLRGIGSGETLLLVDDDADVRIVASELLREMGYHVIEAADGHGALKILQSGVRIDMLVTDVGLPNGLNGRQVADAAREIIPDLPVLFITGYAGLALEQQLDPGMELIGKPFALTALVSRVQSMAHVLGPRDEGRVEGKSYEPSGDSP